MGALPLHFFRQQVQSVRFISFFPLQPLLAHQALQAYQEQRMQTVLSHRSPRSSKDYVITPARRWSESVGPSPPKFLETVAFEVSDWDYFRPLVGLVMTGCFVRR